jgi:septum formation protein
MADVMESTSSHPRLILASTSIYRRQLLERLGVPFSCRSPICDESIHPGEERTPKLLAERLATTKVRSVQESDPDAVIIGCDQLVAFRGHIFGKPGTAERAAAQLESMSGQTHDLITAMVVIDRDEIHEHTDVTTLRMRSLSRQEIERYVDADAPLDCAGSYKLESRGIVLFDEIRSSDHTAITGLPLIALTSILRNLGFPIP